MGNVYLEKDGLMFTARETLDGTVLATAEEVYAEWLMGQNMVSTTLPTIEQRTAALESAMLAMLGGAANV